MAISADVAIIITMLYLSYGLCGNQGMAEVEMNPDGVMPWASTDIFRQVMLL